MVWQLVALYSLTFNADFEWALLAFEDLLQITYRLQEIDTKFTLVYPSGELLTPEIIQFSPYYYFNFDISNIEIIQ